MADPTRAAQEERAKRARMACRVYLKLHEAGPAGAPITKDDALGPDADADADFPVAVEVVARFMDDTILDEPGHAGGVPHYALTAGMRRRMDEGDTLARLRAALTGGAATARVPELEATIRTGRPDAPGL